MVKIFNMFIFCTVCLYFIDFINICMKAHNSREYLKPFTIKFVGNHKNSYKVKVNVYKITILFITTRIILYKKNMKLFIFYNLYADFV